MLLVTHPTGNANVNAVLRGLSNAGRDFLFQTTIGLTANSVVPRTIPGALRRELERRRFPVRSEQLSRRPWREAVRLFAGRVGISALSRNENAWASVYSVYRDLDAYTARRHVTHSENQWSAVYCYEDGALDTFSAARAVGIPTVYDLPIAYWEMRQQLLAEEIERLPEWKVTLPGSKDSAQKCERKTRELESADAVVCPSRFVYDSLPEDARRTKHCIIAEFGSPIVGSNQQLKPQTARGPNAKLRVLFAGSLTQRKGLADVFAAIKQLQRADVELVLLGSPVADIEFYRSQLPSFTYEPPRPHAGVLEVMRSCDVFVLPSLAEGRALVQQEAMMCGLPIIVTANAGAADLIEEGRTGFLVPIRAPERIAECIAWCADHRSALPEMSRAAREKASEYSWEAYGRKVVGFIDQVISSNSSKTRFAHCEFPAKIAAQDVPHSASTK
jgi:glycosyltransferase involved in cell wall biosynthesis